MIDNPLRPKTRSEVTHLVFARQKTYLNSREIYLPNKPYGKLEDGYEPTEEIPLRTSGTTSHEDKEERTKQRAFTAMKDIVLCNVFELFVTFTFKSGRDNPDLCKSKMNGWLKRQRKLDKSFQYVLVPEFHKDGVSLHFHALISGYKGRIVRAVNAKTGRPIVKKKRKVYDFPNYTLGHSEVYYIGETEEDRIKSGFYLLKYVKKELPEFGNKKRYWSSRGLNKPVVIDNPEKWYLDTEPDKTFVGDYGTFLYFKNKDLGTN